MVDLAPITASIELISSELPAGLVAVFVGGTGGIGEATLKALAKYAKQPTIYIIGRSSASGARIVAECKAINYEGRYEFIQADVSTIKATDEVCAEIKKREKVINILFLTAMVLSLSRESE